MNNFTPNSTPISLDGVNLKEVDRFTNLGCSIANDGEVRNESGIRIGKSGAAFRSMNWVWNDNNISLKNKMKLYDSIKTAVLLYGSKSWKGIKEIEERVR